MHEIEFVPLPNVGEGPLIELMNDPAVRKHLPLAAGAFTPDACRAFLRAKQALWDAHGYGPWAFYIHGDFAGWGGLQPEHGDADFALVLSPKFWGWGRRIFRAVVERAFGHMKLPSITALLPPSRLNARVLTRLGFVADGQVLVDGQRFLRFRLDNPAVHHGGSE